jgi:hypothetical protein
MACSDHKHPLQRGGTTQSQRLAPPLESGYARIDEKTAAHRIVYAEALAAFLKNYTPANQALGTWKPFFSNDVSAMLAAIAVQDIDAYRLEISSRFALLRANDPASFEEVFASLFNGILTLSQALDDLLFRLPSDPPLKESIASLARGRLGSALNRLLSYFKAAESEGLLVEADIPEWKILNTPVQKASTIIAEGLSDTWIINGAPDWEDYANGIIPDPSIFGDPAGSDEDKIRHTTNHNLFTSIFDEYLRGYTAIVKGAAEQLILTLKSWRRHAPHYTLFLSFLRLFDSAQTELNRFTSRHLQFYYEEVLRMRRRAPQPDRAHIVIELAKSVDEYLLPKDTLFKAGKDSAGQELLYGLEKDVVFNKGKVASLMAVYQGTANDNIGSVTHDRRLFAAPVINSADGLGAKLTSSNGEWHPFVNRTFIDGDLISIDAPPARIGFGIASHYLALAEGERNVAIRLKTSADDIMTEPHFEIYLTTEKGWHQAPGDLSFAIGTFSDNITSCIELSFTLSPLDPPITNYDPAVHGENLDVSIPVAKIVLRNDPNEPYEYESCRDVLLTAVEVEVEVGNANAGTYSQQGVKQLLIATSFGPVDPSKPFQPFGSRPEAGDAFTLGSKEIFSKENAKIRFNAEWLKVPLAEGDIVYGDDAIPTATVQRLSGGTWTDLASSAEIFDGTESTVVFPETMPAVPAEATVPYDDDFQPYSNQSKAGFLRIKLNGTFGHKEQQTALTAYLIGQSQPNPPDEDPPVEPYLPILGSLFVGYTASALRDLTAVANESSGDPSIRFFHFYPFGHSEQPSTVATDIYLLPQFRYSETAADPEAESGSGGFDFASQGEFYLGLENLAAGQSISLLFQVLEGSTDPLISKPDEHVFFSYLSNNEWKAIRRNLVSDSTRQLIQSGLMEFAIPEDATTTNTVLPSGYLWLRFSVEKAVDAVCKLLAIYPQAASVLFRPSPLNAQSEAEAQLPANRITKLKEPLSAVKKIQQPYPSFGRRGHEKDSQFYTRVSEQLRHKSRAINIWDYERLVLEAFPELYQVKCLSHTKLVENPENEGELLYSELAPGYVTIITIPDVQHRNDTNPLKPYTNADLLARVQEYLTERTSCHSKVIAANPLFEEVRMEFTVTLLPGYNDAAFYKTLLREEITEYLAPWAFGGNADIQFGGKIFKSALIDFVEELPYVDFLTDVKLYHKPGESASESGDLEEVLASTARSILVSVPAVKHSITVLLHTPASEITEECEHDE